MKKQPPSRQHSPSASQGDKGASSFLEHFPIVGIGASAGGLPAFLSLLEHLPINTGMAFVLVQHLSPKHQSILPALLAKATALPVLEATEGLELAPDHIYVSPPGVRLTLMQEALHLDPRPTTPAKPRLIDDFLSSLAKAAPARAIGVLLSGTGSDGTRGLQAIHEAGGVTLVEDPASARFGAMPTSAIKAGCVNYVLSPQGIAGTLAQLANLTVLPPPAKAPGAAPPVTLPEQDLQRMFGLLRNAVGVDFTHYKPTTIHRRVERRMFLSKVESLDEYVRYLEAHPEELELLHQDLLIHVTSFFRDPQTFEALQRTVFPTLFRHRDAQLPFRLWVPACSTGEEVYSLVISLMEFLDETETPPLIQVFATDLSEAAIEQARTAIYPASITSNVSPERLRRFFVKIDGGYQIDKSLRNLCIFAQQNLVSDPPFSRVDLISCRNVLIYLGPALQQKLLPILHYALRPDGFLVLGTSETVGASADLFSLVDKRCKIYRKKNTSPRPSMLFSYRDSLPDRSSSARHKHEPVTADLDPQKEADRLVLARYGPPGVIINEDMEILHFRGHVGPYLELVPGAASLHLLKMAREGLALELRTAIHRAKKSGSRFRKAGVTLPGGAPPRRVNLDVHPLRSSPGARAHCFLVLFEELREPPPAPRLKGRRPSSESHLDRAQREIERLREELLVAQERLQTLVEDQEATNEALRSATEETQTTNEELQTTNEELESAKEELQSTNEELTTVNEELQNRNLELSQLNGDLVNLLSSTQIATVILGHDRRIRRFTPMAGELLKLSPADLGRPLRDMHLGISLPQLETAITEVTERLSVIEQEVCDRQGHWYSMRLRPYKTLDNKIDGAVLTLLDIDRLKRTLNEARYSRDYAKAIVETMRTPFLVLDANLHVVNANPAFYATFQVAPEHTLGRPLYTLGSGQWDIPQLRHLMEEILPSSKHLQDFVIEHDFDAIGRRRMLLNARQLFSEGMKTQYILLSLEDISRKT